MKTAFTTIAMLFAMFTTLSLSAQGVYNANNADIDFGGSGVTITYKVGSGTAAGDIVLYEDVLNVSGTAIDAIVRIISLNGTVTTFDSDVTSGFGMSNNEERFFSPQFTFPSGGGSCMFQIDFIEDGSYDNSMDTGTLVVLENIMLNTYDIDGNGGMGSNQFNEFGGYDTITLGVNTNILSSYNFTTGLTTFTSNTNSNVFNVLDDDTRINVGYPYFSSYEIVVGALSSGAAYFFLDFGEGATWTGSTNTYYPPTLDLDTTTSGNGNTDTICTQPLHLTTNGVNITSPGSTIAAVRMEFDSTEMIDGVREKLCISGATSGDSIALNFSNGQTIANIVFQGTTFNVTASVDGTESVLNFIPASGTITVLQAETFMDSLVYYNPVGTTGVRNFKLFLIDDAFASVAANFSANVNCGILPVSLLNFDALLTEGSVALNWSTATEENSSHFFVERSLDLDNWQLVEQVQAAGFSTSPLTYYSNDYKPFFGTSYYRLVQVDYNEQQTFSEYVSIENDFNKHSIVIRFNPTDKEVIVISNELDLDAIQLIDGLGRDLSHLVKVNQISKQEYRFDLTSLKGLVVFKAENESKMLNLY